MKSRERTYRRLMSPSNLVSFRVAVKETDLYMHAARNLKGLALDAILKHRGYLEAYIGQWPGFVGAMTPWRMRGPAPEIVNEMAQAGKMCGVGPMAAVAGAMAAAVGRELLGESDDVMVENGGDVFIRLENPITVAIYAGKSPLSMRVGLRFGKTLDPMGVCTSSGTVGHSTSFGKADAVCVISDSCALADAAATAVGNRINGPKDLQVAVDYGSSIEGVRGLVAIFEDALAIWGDLEVVPIGKKG
jgi:uncharacterized protein